MSRSIKLIAAVAAVAFVSPAFAQLKGPSTASTPYVLPLPAVSSYVKTMSLLTVDNTGSTPDDVVPLTGSVTGETYGMNGIPDGLGAFDNGDRTFTLLMNHEIASGGVVRAHGVNGAYVSKWIINKDTLAVVSGSDLITSVIGWNRATQASDASQAVTPFSRFCSADLAASTAFYDPATGLGTQARIFLSGEENSAAGYREQATIVTGPDAGKSYTLGKFNLATATSVGTFNANDGVGSWENAVANPVPQTKTVVVGTNDGGTGIMTNAVSVWVGNKTNTGSEAEKAGLINGALKFVNVSGQPVEVVNGTTRATSITSGTPFTLSANASTTFSRPEDAAWNPLNPSQLYFVTTDRLDQVSDAMGAQIGTTRLWRLNFSDIANPEAGGTIDLLIDSDIVDGKKVNMFDNITVSPTDGHIFLQEDVGGAAHNGKVFEYDPATDKVSLLLAHDVARFGDLTVSATTPFNNDEETSGIIDISDIMRDSALNTYGTGFAGEKWLLSSDQAHYLGQGLTTAQVEGGQLFAVHVVPEPAVLGLLPPVAALAGRRNRRGC